MSRSTDRLPAKMVRNPDRLCSAAKAGARSCIISGAAEGNPCLPFETSLMFTGIIMDVGCVCSVRRVPYGARLAVSPGKALSVAVSDSVAVNGVCLTADAVGENLIEFDVVRETLGRSTLGGVKPGELVNLETALPAGAPLGGHFVQGHVDAVCVVSAINRDVRERELRLKCPPEALR